MKPATATSEPLRTETIDAYLAQIALSLRPSSVISAAGVLKRFVEFVDEFDPTVVCVGQLERRHIEGYKTWLAAPPGKRSDKAATATIRHRLSTMREHPPVLRTPALRW